MITHEGKVALRYFQPVPKYVKIGTKEYVCTVQHSVSMLLVPPDEVASLLAVTGGCCGGKRLVFSHPSQEAFNVWLTGQR